MAVCALLVPCCLCPFAERAQAALPVRAAMLLNLSTGAVLYEQNADTAIPPASLTKIMTMHLALDAVKNKRVSLHQKFRIRREDAATGGSSMHLRAGERVPLVRLLTGIAVVSGNDAAMALARGINGSPSNFVRQMNRKARALGLRHTVFKNPTGLPAAGQTTTARDMMRLCQAYLKAHPQAMRFHGIRNFLHKGLCMRNTNTLLGTVNGVNGLKTGFTMASGYHVVATATRGKTRLLAIVLGASSKKARDAAARRMLEAGFRQPRQAAAVKRQLAGGAPRSPAGKR